MSRLMVLMTKKQFVLVRSVPIRLRQMSPASVLASTSVAAAYLTQKISAIKSKVKLELIWFRTVCSTQQGLHSTVIKWTFQSKIYYAKNQQLKEFYWKMWIFLTMITMLIYYLDTKTCSLRRPLFQRYCGIFFFNISYYSTTFTQNMRTEWR